MIEVEESKIPDVDFKLIKKWLRHGDIADLAMKAKISRAGAYKILKGESKNWDFLELCYSRAIENKAKFRRLQDALSI